MDIFDPEEAERLIAMAPEEALRRRDFMERLARYAGASAAVAMGVGCGPTMKQAAANQRKASPRGDTNIPIDTFVVLMMENRSFDHFLGWLPGADGRQAGLEYTDDQGKVQVTHAMGDDYQGCALMDPPHNWAAGRVQFNHGLCDGFLRDTPDTYPIAYYEEHQIPFLAACAREFAVCDRYFSSLLGSTYPNKCYSHAAQSFGDKALSNIPGDGILPQFPTPDRFPPNECIGGRLEAVGLEALTFYSDVNFASVFGPVGEKRGRPLSEYFARAATGKLPAVSFVDPTLLVAKELSGLSTDQHPRGDIRSGEAFISEVVHAFVESPQWRRGALFFVYDEWGGFYDHVRPPSVPDARSSKNIDDDFGQMGFRVPAVVLSPYSRQGHIAHSEFGHESILKIIEERYGLKPLTVRDAKANSIASAFDFGMKPRLEPPTLPRPKHIVSQLCPQLKDVVEREFLD